MPCSKRRACTSNPTVPCTPRTRRRSRCRKPASLSAPCFRSGMPGSRTASCTPSSDCFRSASRSRTWRRPRRRKKSQDSSWLQFRLRTLPLACGAFAADAASRTSSRSRASSYGIGTAFRIACTARSATEAHEAPPVSSGLPPEISRCTLANRKSSGTRFRTRHRIAGTSTRATVSRSPLSSRTRSNTSFACRSSRTDAHNRGKRPCSSAPTPPAQIRGAALAAAGNGSSTVAWRPLVARTRAASSNRKRQLGAYTRQQP